MGAAAVAARPGLFGPRGRYVPFARQPVDPIYNETYRRQVEVWLRAICDDPKVRLQFGTDGSYTDMEGLIVVDKTVPPDGRPGEKGLATWGLASHEACHHRKTSRSVFLDFIAKMKNTTEAADRKIAAARTALVALPGAARVAELDRVERAAHHEAVRLDQVVLPALTAKRASVTGPALAGLDAEISAAEAARDEAAAVAADAARTKAKVMGPHKADYDAALSALHDAMRAKMRATQRKDLWNIVEDGRIETWLRVREPFEYHRISLLNRVYPRVPETYKGGGQMRLAPCPDGYVPVDADGNELEVVTGPDGKRQVVIGPDTELPVFTDKPLDPKRQMRAALLSDAVPEFSAHDKDLHPEVRACLDECKPLIDDGVRGDTANCLERAGDLLDVLERHGMLPDPEDDKSNSGQSQQQGGGGGGESGESGDDQQQGGGGGGGGESEEGSDWDERGDAGGSGEGTSDASGQAADGEDGGGISKEEREQAEAEGRGSASDEEAQEAADAEERKQQKAAKGQEAKEKSAASRGDIDGDGWGLPPDQKITGNETIRAQGSGPPATGHLNTYGNQISSILEDIKTQERGPERHLKSGRLDRRRLTRIPIGDDDVFWREGQELELDLAVDAVFDLSGSMDGERQALQDAAVTMDIAARKTEIPMAMYGYDSGGGQTARHYEFRGYRNDAASALGEIAGRTNPASRAGGGTPTKEAVEFAHARLRHRRESTRLMIVFTDGQPNDGGEESRKAVEQARRDGIPVMGVWFRGDDRYADGGRQGMQRIFGGDFVEIGNIAELPRAFRKRLFEIIKGKRSRRSG